jgi:hypothetical protein
MIDMRHKCTKCNEESYVEWRCPKCKTLYNGAFLNAKFRIHPWQRENNIGQNLEELEIKLEEDTIEIEEFKIEFLKDLAISLGDAFLCYLRCYSIPRLVIKPNVSSSFQSHFAGYIINFLHDHSSSGRTLDHMLVKLEFTGGKKTSYNYNIMTQGKIDELIEKIKTCNKNRNRKAIKRYHKLLNQLEAINS